jgi:hypothetical protein
VSIGAKAVITTSLPAGDHESGWTEVGHLDGNSIDVLLLKPASNASR